MLPGRGYGFGRSFGGRGYGVGVGSAAAVLRGGDDAFHPGWKKKDWKKKQRLDELIFETINTEYSRLMGIIPPEEVFAKIANSLPDDLILEDMTAIVNAIVLRHIQRDDEEILLLLM